MLLLLFQIFSYYFLKTSFISLFLKMDSSDGEDPIPFIDISNVEDNKNVDSSDVIADPNMNQNTRYFQKRIILKDWDYRIPLNDQPRRLNESGPVELDFPGHFFEVEGGVCVISFEKDRSTKCLCTITQINEIERTFRFQVFNWIGKSKKTWIESGKTFEAKADSVWELVHRTEFESETEISNIQVGQVLRIVRKNSFLDVTGFCKSVTRDELTILILTGLEEGKICKVQIENIASVIEVLSCPLFYRLKKKVSGTQDGDKDLKWEPDEPQDFEEEKDPVRPRMLLRCPESEKNPRVWHFYSIFPKPELEYCCNV